MQTKQLTIRVEVWLAAAMLHQEGHPTFLPSRLVEEIERRFGDTRPGVETHVRARCVATAPAHHTPPLNYLTRNEDGLYRLFRAGDAVHPDRMGAEICPRQAEIPEEHWGLWTRWAPQIRS